MTDLDTPKLPYQLSLMQQRWVLHHAIMAAGRARVPEAARILSEASAVSKAAADVDLAYQAASGSQPDGGDTRKADREVVRCLKAIHDVLSLFGSGDRKEARTRNVAALHKVVFPHGYAHHAQTTYEERMGLTDHVIEVMGMPDHAAIVTDLALAPILALLQQGQAAFRRLAEPEMVVTQEDREAALSNAKAHFIWAISSIIGMFNPSDPAKMELRDTILFPLAAMNRKIAQRRKQRNRGIADGDVAPPADILPEASDLQGEVAQPPKAPAAAACEPAEAMPPEGGDAEAIATDAPVGAANAPVRMQGAGVAAAS